MDKGKGKPRSEERRMKETVAFRLFDEDHACLVDKACDAGFDSVGAYVRAVALDAARVEESKLRPLLAFLRKLDARLQALGMETVGRTSGASTADLQDIADQVAFLRRHVARMLA